MAGSAQKTIRLKSLLVKNASRICVSNAKKHIIQNKHANSSGIKNLNNGKKRMAICPFAQAARLWLIRYLDAIIWPARSASFNGVGYVVASTLMITIMRTILKVVLGSSSQILSMIEDKLIMKEEEEIGVTIAFYKFWEL
jgi:hypothetical protein